METKEKVLPSRNPLPIVVGVGNEYRGDDAAGLEVARRLRRRIGDAVTVHEQSGEATGLMKVMEDAESLVLVDAVQSEAAPGTLHRFDASAEPLPAQMLRCSTHNMSVTEAVELARALGQLPARVIVYGIEGRRFDPGTGLSEEVACAIDEAVNRILEEIGIREDPARKE